MSVIACSTSMFIAYGSTVWMGVFRIVDYSVCYYYHRNHNSSFRYNYTRRQRQQIVGVWYLSDDASACDLWGHGAIMFIPEHRSIGAAVLQAWHRLPSGGHLDCMLLLLLLLQLLKATAGRRRCIRCRRTLTSSCPAILWQRWRSAELETTISSPRTAQRMEPSITICINKHAEIN